MVQSKGHDPYVSDLVVSSTGTPRMALRSYKTNFISKVLSLTDVSSYKTKRKERTTEKGRTWGVSSVSHS